MSLLFLALGSNVGDPLVNLRAAQVALASRMSHVKCSSIYQTKPWGGIEQPDFFNVVLSGFWTQEMDVFEILKYCKLLEVQLGRKQTVKYGPRVIDIDIVSYGDLVLKTEDLEIPHPRITEREFVLWPLLEIAPNWVHPAEGKSAAFFQERLSKKKPWISKVTLPLQSDKETR